MNNSFNRSIASKTVKLLDKVLSENANTASSIMFYENKQPVAIKRFKKHS